MLPNNLLRGQKVRLTAFREADYAAMVEWFQDPYFLRHLDAVPVRPQTEAQVRKKFEDEWSHPNNIAFAVRTLDGDELVGIAEINAVLWNQGVTWVALGMGRRGEGYGQEALELLVDYAFRELNMRRVQLSVFDYNHPAIHVYEKLGFVKEGSYREFLHRDGQVYDMYLYGLLRREWDARQQAKKQ